jgi:hypothetical protein
MKTMICPVVLLGAMLFGGVRLAAAAHEFSNADVRGPYGSAFDGTVVTPTGSAAAAAIARFAADGAGNIFNGARTLVVGGTVVHQTFRCTYSVQPRGNGTATCEFQTGGVVTGTEHYDFVLVDDGEEALFVATDPGVTIHGRAERQRKR